MAGVRGDGNDDRAQALLTAALARPGPAERAAFLDGACHDDPILRARVEALLGANDRAQTGDGDGDGDRPSGPAGLLDSRPPDSHPIDSRPLDQTAAAPPASEGPGAAIGRYKLLQLIGEGGFGAVYMAEQQHPVRRRVALKVIKLGMDTRQVIARFEAERQALAMMDHPNIARVLDAGTTETGRPYFVMELVKGVPITQYCDQGHLTTPQRLELFIPVCQAVQHAHQKGIIHRDLKPSNVMVTLHDGVPVPKVIDFGIAKATQARLTDKTLFTEFRQFVGTPAYMSPEQAEMSGLDVDTRSDIYSLGVLLYELLTGATPFDHKQFADAAYGEIQRIIREVDPPRPSTRLSTMGQAGLTEIAKHRGSDPASLGRQIRGDLDWIVMRCLEKDRTRRYETANGLAADVRRHLNHEPVHARPVSAGYRVRKFATRHKVGVAAGAAVAAALLLGLGGTAVGLVRARAAQRDSEAARADADRQRNVALGLLKDVQQAKAAGDRARADAEREAARARAANAFTQDMLGAVQPEARQGGADVKVADVLDRAAARLEKLSGQPELELDARLTLARTYSSLRLNAKSIEQYNRALELSRSLSGPESEQTLQITADLLWDTVNGSGGAFGEPLARQTVAAATRVLGERHRTTLDARNSLGLTLMAARRYPEAEAVFRDLVRMARAGPPLDYPRGTSRFFHNLAAVLSLQGRTGEAEQLQREALAVQQSAPGVDDVRRAGGSQSMMGTILAEQDKLAEAEASFRDALAQRRAALGDAHPDTIYAGSALAELLERRGNYAAALPLVDEVASRMSAADQGGRYGLYVHFRRAELQLRSGRDEAARASFADALAGVRKLAAAEPSYAPTARYRWAQASLLLGLRTDRTWAGPALQARAKATAWEALTRHWWGDPVLDEVDWSRLRFRVERWPGDTGEAPNEFAAAAAAAAAASTTTAAAAAAAAAAPPAVVAEGGLNELWSTGDPPPGLYLISLSIPRRTGAPLREAEWMLVSPWQLSLYSLREGMLADDTAKWAALFRGEPTERRTTSSLDYMREGLLEDGFGPLRRGEQFAIAGTTRVTLPTGRYNVRALQDGRCRVWLDGDLALDAWDKRVSQSDIVEFTAGRPRELRVEFGPESRRLMVDIAPAWGPTQWSMVEAAQGGLHDIEAELERLQDQIASGPVTGQLLFERGLALCRVGRFADARDDLDKSIDADPAVPIRWYIRGCLLAYLGEAGPYRAHCRAMAERFGAAGNAQTCEWTAKTCSLLPGGTDDPAFVVRLADRAVDSGGQYIAWFLISKAIAEFRAGRYAEADASFERAIAMRLNHGHGEATAGFFHALTLLKLGRADEARTLLDVTERKLAVHDQVPGERDPGIGGIENWFTAQIARREAYQTIANTAPPPRRAKAAPAGSP